MGAVGACEGPVSGIPSAGSGRSGRREAIYVQMAAFSTLTENFDRRVGAPVRRETRGR